MTPCEVCGDYRDDIDKHAVGVSLVAVCDECWSEVGGLVEEMEQTEQVVV